MSYQVLARKWRPRAFTDMVGQEHVLQALKNALDNDRTHHAYLFTGTRGVGKTTLARILAKCLNCIEGVSSSPCGQCDACVGIDEGRFIDLIEVDAASRAKVDETRELMDNVQYAPTVGRFKVYLIDEVHMFSTHSFNALLKTLEEPPPHVKFLLATTELKKVPVTILSRCMQFNLKHLSVAQIDQQLKKILAEENIEFDPDSSQLIAKAANGSVRDALSLLDQAIAFGGGQLKSEQVQGLLGTISSAEVLALIQIVLNKDGDALLQKMHLIAEHNPDYDQILIEMIESLQQIAMLQVLGEKADNEEFVTSELSALADQSDAEHVQLLYQIAITGRRDLSLAPEQKTGFEMTMIRMLAFSPDSQPAENRPSSRSQTQKKTVNNPQPETIPESAKTITSTPTKPIDADASKNWQTIIDEMALVGLVRELAGHSILKSHNDKSVHLALSPDKSHLLNQNQKERLEQAIRIRFGDHMKLVIHVEEPDAATPAEMQARIEADNKVKAEQAIVNDPVVQAMQKELGAVVDPDSIALTENKS